MRPTIRPTAAEMMEKENQHIRSHVTYWMEIRWDEQTGERLPSVKKWWNGFNDDYDETKRYLEEKRLIGLRIEESFFGQPKFILEE